MRPSWRFAIRQREDGFHFERHAHLVDARNHFVDAALADGLELRDFRQQLFVFRVHEIAEQVQFRVVVLGGEFRAGNEFHSRRVAGRRRARTAFNRVVVGQRDARQVESLCIRNEFLRRKSSVGKIRVQV